MKMRNPFVLFLFVVILSGGEAHSQRSQDELEFLPAKKIFPLFTADALSHQLSLSHITKDRDWIGTIGGSIPIAQLSLPNALLQISVAASTFNRLITPPGLTVYTTDFKVDFPLDVRTGSTAFRFALGHYSCHFEDDGIELLGKHSIQSIKDYYTLAVAQDVDLIRGHGYFAVHWIHHNVPERDKQWQLQFGGEGANVQLSEYVGLYCAIDIKLKQEVSWGSTQSYQIGARLFAHDSRALRIAFTMRRGFDERGQFFDQREDVDMVSALIDF